MGSSSNNHIPSSPNHNHVILDSATDRLIQLTSRNNPNTAHQSLNVLKQVSNHFSHNQESIEEILTIIQRKAPKLLDGLTDANKVELAQKCFVRLYYKDEVVFNQGDEPDAYYTVIRGAVSIYALGSNLDKKKKTTNATTKGGGGGGGRKGSIFEDSKQRRLSALSEKAFIAGPSRKASVRHSILNSNNGNSSGSKDSDKKEENEKEMGRQDYGIFVMQIPPGESFGELSFNENRIHTRRNAGVISDGSHGQAQIRRRDYSSNSSSNNNSSTTTTSSSSSTPSSSSASTTAPNGTNGTNGPNASTTTTTTTPSPHTMEASDVCALLLIPEPTYMSVLFPRHSAKHQTKDKISFLKTSVLFKHWTMDQLVKMAYAMKKKQYRKGSVIVAQGERMEHLWIVREGGVRVVHRILPSLGGGVAGGKGEVRKQMIVEIADIGKNDVFGLIECMDPSIKKSQREMVATCSTEMFFLPFSSFKPFLTNDLKTFTIIEKVAERRKKWETLRKEYASKFPNMLMTLPKDASTMSNYAMDGCDETKKKKPTTKPINNKRGKGSSANGGSRRGNGSSSSNSNNPPGNVQMKGMISHGGGSGGGGGGGGRGNNLDDLMRKNRESTLDMLVAQAGLS